MTPSYRRSTGSPATGASAHRGKTLLRAERKLHQELAVDYESLAGFGIEQAAQPRVLIVIPHDGTIGGGVLQKLFGSDLTGA
jgi:hypothetical protein